MLKEVIATAEHIVSLIKGRQESLKQEQSGSISSSAPKVGDKELSIFADSLKATLSRRVASCCWVTQEPEKGSARRAVVWQVHESGEGADKAILDACRAIKQSQIEEGEICGQETNKEIVELALSLLPQPFTLWMDPGCVAIRMGPGPGASRSSWDVESKSSGSASHSSSVNIVWGELFIQKGNSEKPLVTISNSSAPIRRPIAIVDPQSRYPSSLGRGHGTASGSHGRSPSTSSSSIDSMSRSASLSSENSTSTYATSYSSGEESDRCPSLVSPSSSSTSSQDISDNEQDHEERLMRMMIKSSPFPGASLLFDDDGEELGDLTVRPIDFDATLGLESEAPISSTPRKKTFDINSPTKTASKVTTAWSQEQLQQQQLKKKDALTTARKPAGHGRQESFSSSTTSEAPPIKANYTIHDNGNVGVLGGGVRLGGTSSSSHKKSRDNNSSHNPSKSSSYAGSYYRFPQPFDQAYYHGMGHYSAPTRTIPLPGTSGHLYPTQSYSSSNYLIHPSYPTILPYASYSPVNTIPQLPPPHGYHHRGSGHFGAAQYQQVPPSTFDAGGPNNTGGLARGFQAPSSLMAASGADSDTGDEPCLGGNTKEGGKRVRSRGRRSRGRGAGRAARRQAAALKALQEANPNMNLSSTLEDLRLSSLGLELESNRSGSALGSNYSFTTAGSNSRCSTPSPFNAESLSSSSEYASSSNSCFSSVSSTPAKLAACEVAKDRFNASRFLLPELGRKRMVGTDREDLDLDLDLNFCLNLGQIDLKLDAHSNMAHQSQQTNGEASSQAGVGYTGLTPTWSLTMATPRIGCV